MLKVGVTGGIGSGKSTICNLLLAMNFPVFFADVESKKLCNEYLPLKDKLISAFGHEIYNLNGELNRALFATIIFNDSSKLHLANSIIHPEVKDAFLRFAKKSNKELVFIESALLIGGSLENEIDKILLVSSPEELRKERVMSRDGVEESLVLERIKNQLSEDVLKMKAHYIIVNDDNELIIPQLEEIIVQLSDS